MAKKSAKKTAKKKSAKKKIVAKKSKLKKKTSKKERSQTDEQVRTAKKKEAFLLNYETNLNIMETCKAIGINRATFYRWINDDNEFEDQVQNVDVSKFHKIDGSLMKVANNAHTKSGVAAAIYLHKFYARRLKLLPPLEIKDATLEDLSDEELQSDYDRTNKKILQFRTQTGT